MAIENHFIYHNAVNSPYAHWGEVAREMIRDGYERVNMTGPYQDAFIKHLPAENVKFGPYYHPAKQYPGAARVQEWQKTNPQGQPALWLKSPSNPPWTIASLLSRAEQSLLDPDFVVGKLVADPDWMPEE